MNDDILDPGLYRAIRSLGWRHDGSILSRKRRGGAVETADLRTFTHNRPQISGLAGEVSEWTNANDMLRHLRGRRLSMGRLQPPIWWQRLSWQDLTVGQPEDWFDTLSHKPQGTMWWDLGKARLEAPLR